MFGFGLIEIGIVVFLGYLAFKNFIARRYPNLHRTINFILIATAVLMVAFGLMTHFAKAA